MPAVYNYDPNIPFANNAPRDDQPIMQQNAVSIQGIISVDHENFGSTTNGYHTVIHQRTGAGTQNLTRSGIGATYTNVPANIPGVNQVIAGLYTPDTAGGTADTQLFNLTGNGGISQLTGNTASAEGWVWSGGILLQWGHVTSTANGGSVTFKNRGIGAIEFPNNCLNVSMTLSTSAGFIAFPSFGVLSFDKTQFTWRALNLGGAGADGFYWFAVGN